MDAFSSRGIRTLVITRNYAGLSLEEISGSIHVLRSPTFGRVLGINGIIYFIYSVRQLLRFRARYDVVHCQQLFGPAMAAVFAGFVTKKPAVVRVTLSGGTGEAAAVRKMPFSGIRLRLLRRVRRWIVLNGEMREEIEGLGISRERIRVIYNGTDLPDPSNITAKYKEDLRNEMELPSGFLGVFAGRLSEEKNLDVLIRAWASLLASVSDSYLLIIGGDSAYRGVGADLRELAERLGITRHVRFLGHQPNVKDYILASDVFVLPSSAEGMSNSLVEAFSCGASIIASDIRANMELCEHGSDSLVVSVRNEAALLNALQKVSSDKAFAEKIGRSARAKAERLLSRENMIASYISVYQEAAKDNG